MSAPRRCTRNRERPLLHCEVFLEQLEATKPKHLRAVNGLMGQEVQEQVACEHAVEPSEAALMQEIDKSTLGELETLVEKFEKLPATSLTDGPKSGNASGR